MYNNHPEKCKLKSCYCAANTQLRNYLHEKSENKKQKQPFMIASIWCPGLVS